MRAMEQFAANSSCPIMSVKNKKEKKIVTCQIDFV